MLTSDANFLYIHTRVTLIYTLVKNDNALTKHNFIREKHVNIFLSIFY